MYRILVLAILFALSSSFVVSSNAPKPADDEKILHVLNRLSYGPRPTDIERVRKMGLERYIELQLQPTKIDDSSLTSRLERLDTLAMSTRELMQAYPLPKIINGDGKKNRLEIEKEDIKGRPHHILYDLTNEQLLRAVYSERQLQEVMVDFWTNHFNVFWGKGINRYLTNSYIHDVIRPNALGKFPDLLRATAESPAMLFYLDNWMSVDPQSSDRLNVIRDRIGRGSGRFRQRPNLAGQRRRIGLNENYARELMELHTLGVDGGYTQKDVTEVARCFTGWTIKHNPVEFTFNRFLHDDREKVVLGVKIPAGGGKSDGDRVLEILASHPSTARFISEKLVRHFVSDRPDPALVARVAESYKKTGGDIPSMLRVIFSSEEFYSPKNRRAKVKSPLALIASALRALDAETTGGMQYLNFLNKMGQPLFLCQAPTGYGDTAEDWISTNSLVERMNFAIALSEGRIVGTHAKLRIDPGSIESISRRVLLYDLSPSTLKAIEAELGREITTEKINRALALILGSPDFQRM